MAVNSKADKTHGLKSWSVAPNAMKRIASTGAKKPAYVALPAPVTGVMRGPIEPAAKPGNALGTAGTKALLMRAKKELGPISDPTQSLAD